MNLDALIWEHRVFPLDYRDLLPMIEPRSPILQVYSLLSEHRSFDYKNFGQQSDALAVVLFLFLFFNTVYVCHSFSSKELAAFNFVAIFAIHSDFAVQGNKICCYFHIFTICLP